MKDPRSHWAARELCEHFIEARLGAQWLPLLERSELVAKSSTSTGDMRPSARTHFDSLVVRPNLAAGLNITVVDDVITRGATMLAAVARLQEALPGATVRGFALIRTISDEEIRTVKEPVRGTIRMVPWGTRREP
jgi:predicted amidophosphoribosyltransferase